MVSPTPLQQAIKTESSLIKDQLISLRRDLHQHPEIAGNEKRTSAVISKLLNDLGLEVHEAVGGYGVVGILKTDKPGKHIAWRADIDALSTNLEEDPADFKSVNKGVRHICGHDVHTTIALGIAHSLTQLKAQLSGTYYFVFQPAEENITGAKAMLDDGLLDLIQPDEFFALHMTPFPTGIVATKPGELYAHYKKVVVRLDTQDPKIIDAVKEQMRTLTTVKDTMFGKDSSFEDPIKGIVGTESIYQKYSFRESDIWAQQEGEQTILHTYYSFSDDAALSDAGLQLQNLFDHEELSTYIKSCDFEPVSYVLKNHPETTRAALETLQQQFPQQTLELSGVFPGGRSDDFALFLDKVPGTYFFVGATDVEKNIIAMPHAPFFQVDEKVIGQSVEIFGWLMAKRARSPR